MSTEPVAQRLARVWADVLGVDHVAPTDNFFQLGGNSLHAVRIVGRAEEEFGVHLSVLSVLASPDVGAMAADIERTLRLHRG